MAGPGQLDREPEVGPLADGALVEAALDWFADHERDLPWRRTRDGWSILVSELMLQQTQVARVLVRWPEFLEQFPTPARCAQASPAEVIGAWAGLGYNRRAINLHRAASVIVEDHDGRVPDDLGDLLSLPGIGPYTARAVRVFAFCRDDGVVDTNVARILARTANARLSARTAQQLADAAVPPGEGWRWNQLLFDVGATLCRPRDPKCPACPFRSGCGWYRSGRPDPDPATGSAGVSGRQSRFDGSDRQGRGRLVAALGRGPVAPDDLAVVMGWPDDGLRARRVAATLVDDGLVECSVDGYRLPG